MVDFAIPANDDASKSVQLITKYCVDAIKEGLSDRKKDKDKETEEATEKEEVAG
jgi:small subunit ribosomal protein S2